MESSGSWSRRRIARDLGIDRERVGKYMRLGSRSDWSKPAIVPAGAVAGRRSEPELTRISRIFTNPTERPNPAHAETVQSDRRFLQEPVFSNRKMRSHMWRSEAPEGGVKPQITQSSQIGWDEEGAGRNSRQNAKTRRGGAATKDGHEGRGFETTHSSPRPSPP